jgi:hypothetical protein
MSLYPITVATAATLSINPNLIASGSLIAVPIDMTANQMIQIILQQASNTQDFGLRASISLWEDGIAIGETYPLLRFAGLPVVVYVEGQTPPVETVPILVAPGYYFVNVLNLTNSPAYFAFSQTILV